MWIWIANKFAKFHTKKNLIEVKIVQKVLGGGLLFWNKFLYISWILVSFKVQLLVLRLSKRHIKQAGCNLTQTKQNSFWFGSAVNLERLQTGPVGLTIAGVNVKAFDCVRDLGVHLDSRLDHQLRRIDALLPLTTPAPSTSHSQSGDPTASCFGIDSLEDWLWQRHLCWSTRGHFGTIT